MNSRFREAENSRMTKADETSRFREEEADYDSTTVGARNWTVKGETTKYLETTSLWPLVDGAKERLTEAEKRPALQEAEKMLAVEMSQVAAEWREAAQLCWSPEAVVVV